MEKETNNKTEQMASDSQKTTTRNVRMRPRRKNRVEDAPCPQKAEAPTDGGLADSLKDLSQLFSKHPELVKNLSGRINDHYQLRIVGGQPHIARMPAKRKHPFDETELRRQNMFAEATRKAWADMRDPLKAEYWKSQIGEKYKTPIGAACAFYYNSLKQKEEIRLKSIRSSQQ